MGSVLIIIGYEGGSDERVRIIWCKVRITGDAAFDASVYYSASRDSGATFGEPYELKVEGVRLIDLRASDVASFGQVVHVVTDVGTFQSLDGGETPIRNGRCANIALKNPSSTSSMNPAFTIFEVSWSCHAGNRKLFLTGR